VRGAIAENAWWGTGGVIMVSYQYLIITHTRIDAYTRFYKSLNRTL